MKTKISIIVALFFVFSCGQKEKSPEAVQSAQEAPAIQMSTILEQAPEGTLATISVQSVEAFKALEKGLGGSSSPEGALTSFIESIPGLGKEGGGNLKAAVHMLISAAPEKPTFELMVPIQNKELFASTYKISDVDSAKGDQFKFVNDEVLLYGNSVGDYIFISEDSDGFNAKSDFISAIASEAPLNRAIRILLNQEKIINSLKPWLEAMGIDIGGADGPFDQLSTLMGGKSSEITFLLGAMKTSQITLYMEKNEIHVELAGTWIEGHEARKDFMGKPCSIQKLVAKLPKDGYALSAHCLPTVANQGKSLINNLREKLGPGGDDTAPDGKLEALELADKKNFKNTATALYAKGTFPFSLIMLTEVDDADISKKLTSHIVESLILQVGSVAGAGPNPFDGVKNLSGLIQSLQAMAPMVGLNISVDEEFPVVGINIQPKPALKSRIPAELLSFLDDVFSSGLEIGVAFDGNWNGMAMGPGAQSELEKAIKSAKSDENSTGKTFKNLSANTRYLLWVDLASALRKMTPLVTLMSSDPTTPRDLLKLLQKTPESQILQISLSGDDKTMSGRVQLPLEMIKEGLSDALKAEQAE